MGADCGCQTLTNYNGGCDNGFNIFWLILIILVIIIAFQHY